MNERIRELMEQCEGGYSTQSEPYYDMEKFAELIVQECIKTVHNRYMGDNNREDMEVLRCVSEMKAQFGVE